VDPLPVIDVAAFEQLRQLAASHHVVRSLHVVAELGVADLVEPEGTSIDVVALGVGADADALRRVLRLLTTQRVFELDGPTVRHTAASHLLRTDHPASLRSFARMMGHEVQWTTVGELMSVVLTGEAATPRLFEGGSWGWLREHPAQEAVFGQAMAAKSAVQIADVLAAHDFRPYGRIVDVGGGEGHLLRAIVHAIPGARGVLFDQPAVVERAREAGTADRLAFVGGDFFETPLPSGDLMILQEVIHDWDDARCGEILTAVRRALPSDGRLLLVEIELTEDGPAWPKLLDVLMLAQFGARQRTNDEYRALLAASGFAVVAQTSTPGGLTLIEARADETAAAGAAPGA
jgi:hypothetical protein